ncbi:hypothetical protein MAPG_01189 [Magnaporthiopsis poae ATCC 64411]|uniref:Retinol dehydrogenase 8 n=1 Tax=Magnaporthiopsis poae (strain ATCC 64411 / 73-15) TaxID=644358 RepID=A0A0C4DN17_MAGP6|nr:hypothetical protein MAPG_01189 [Magnaporthiopsis poae ATCC 64411]
MSALPKFATSAIPDAKFTTPARPLTFLVTGCSSGVGLSLTRAIQDAGHRLIATSRNPSRTPELVAEVERRGGRWLALDVDDADACFRLVDDELEARGEHIDVLVNNAGWSVHQAAEHLTDDEVRAQLETVFFGPFRLARAAVAHMRRRRFGVIVNVSSGIGLEGRESMAAYAAAKSALDAVSKVLYKEVCEFNVRVIMVHLGTFRTNMGNVARAGSVPLADDYKGKAVAGIMDFMQSHNFVGDGDPEKAARAIVEVATGTGVGEGHEAEMFLPLGRDVIPRYRLVRDRLDHALDVFEGVASNVYAED